MIDFCYNIDMNEIILKLYKMFNEIFDKQEKELYKIIKKTKDKTVIIVAQRISTILNADQIIVLDDGNIVGIGTHEELMKNNETYKEIALSQLSKEELE